VRIVDANVLLHAYNVSAPAHPQARRWLENALSDDEALGLPWVVILAFLRISTNPRALPRPLSIDNASEIVDALLNYPPVRVVEPGPEHWLQMRRLISKLGIAGNLTTDTHLAALAIEHGATLISYDSDFSRFEHLRWECPEA